MCLGMGVIKKMNKRIKCVWRSFVFTIRGWRLVKTIMFGGKIRAGLRTRYNWGSDLFLVCWVLVFRVRSVRILWWIRI